MDPVTDRAEKVRIMEAMRLDRDRAIGPIIAKLKWWERLFDIPKIAQDAYCIGWLDGASYKIDRGITKQAGPVRPYLGQRVLYHLTNKPGLIPMAAIVCQVHSDVEVSVVAFTPEGVPLSPAAVNAGYYSNTDPKNLCSEAGHFCVPIPEEQS